MAGNKVSSAAVLAAAVGCAQAAPPAEPLRSGSHEALVLAVDRSGRVAGSFRMEQGEGVTKICAFTFTGQARGGQAAIRVVGRPRDRSPIPAGRIDASGDGVTLRLPRAGSLPGCGLVIGPMVKQAGGIELSRIGPGDWTGLAEVRGARVSLRPIPGGPAGRAHLVRGDVVGVLGRQGGQVRVVYPSERRRPSQGWVAASDLAPLAP